MIDAASQKSKHLLTLERPRTSHRLSFSEREKKILHAALRLFSQKGFKGSTTRAIATKAGVNEALLFRHFPSKASLYNALLEQKLNDAEDYFGPATAKAKDLPLKDGLLYLGKTILDRFRKDAAFMRMVLYAALEEPAFSRSLFRRRLPLPIMLREFFAAKLEAGEIAWTDPETLAQAFFSMLHHYLLITVIFKVQGFFPKGELELLRDYVQILLEGIGS